MEGYIHCEADPKLVENIVCEVKGRGVFDELRRECVSDVDTKPAYQNLRQRVETTVKQFLEQQKWSPEINKLNLRERLRKHIADKGFLEMGVERIVDQVVNPKINTVFLPRIEDISYQYMGVEKPTDRRMKGLTLNTTTLGFLPTLDLEQVSPDSSSKSKSPETEFNAVDDLQKQLDESDDKMEDFESPAFEPHEKVTEDREDASVDMDIAVSDDMDYEMRDDGNGRNEEAMNDIFPNDDGKSNLSSISGLTSNGSVNGSEENGVDSQAVVKETSNSNDADKPQESEVPKDIEKTLEPMEIKPDVIAEAAHCENSQLEEVQTSHANVGNEHVVPTAEYREAIDDVNQDSVLSRVSSNSRLSIITGNNNTNAELQQDDEEAINADSVGPQNSGDGKKVETTIRDMSLCDISEEAQMQKFNDSSSSDNSGGDIGAIGKSATEENATPGTNFDINKDEIIFEGPERKAFCDYGDSPYRHAPANKQRESPVFESITNTNKFEPSSFTVRPDEVSCADLNVENVRTTMSDVFDSNSSQSRSNNLVIIENQDDVKSMEPTLVSQSVSVSPTTSESVPIIEKSSSQDKSTEKKLESGSSRSKAHGDSRISSSSRSSGHHNGKDRHRDRGSSSTSKDRGSSSHTKDKYRKSSSSHSSSRRDKDKSKSSGHESSSRRHESSSSTSKDKPSDSHSRKSSTEKETGVSQHKTSKRERDHPSSSKHSSSSRSSKNSSHRPHSDKKTNDDKHRSESKKTSSKDDDHSVHKHTSKPRERSHSKDSNDGNNLGGAGNATAPNPTIDGKQKSSKSEDQKGGNNENGSAPPVENLSTAALEVPLTIPFVDDDDEPSPMPTSPVGTHAMFSAEKDMADEDDVFVPPAKPVVVDKMLVGNEINLEQFINDQRENRDNPIISKIEETLQSQNKILKPKTAKNFAEAIKVNKRRKQIDRNEQKKLEKARVLAKEFLRTNSSNNLDDTQGVELEFACGSETVRPSGPTISSPVKMTEPKDSGIEQSCTVPLITSSDAMIKTEPDQQQLQPADSQVTDDIKTELVHVGYVEPNDISSTSLCAVDDFLGFDDLDYAEHCIKISTLDKYIDGGSKIQAQLFLENNQLDTDMKLKRHAQKRRYAEISASPSPPKTASNFENRNTINDYSIKNPELFMAKVIISKSDTQAHVKLKSTNVSELGNNGLIGIPKPIKKTRYSNDELFKPRPTISGGSRARRRGLNCDE